MKISELLTHINRACGVGNYDFDDVSGYLDEVVDMVNEELDTKLPLFSEVYANSITYSDAEQALIDADALLDTPLLIFEDNNTKNPYIRIPDRYLRNFVAYEVAFRKLRDEDEDQEVFGLKYKHARDWFTKLVGQYSDYVMDHVDAIVMGDDVDELEDAEDVEDWDNPYWLSDS